MFCFVLFLKGGDAHALVGSRLFITSLLIAEGI